MQPPPPLCIINRRVDSVPSDACSDVALAAPTHVLLQKVLGGGGSNNHSPTAQYRR